MQKEYIGTVSSDISDGIRMMTCGGASTSSDKINATTYKFNFVKNKYEKTKYNLEYEDERSKIIKVLFGETLGKDEQFKVK